MIKKLFAQALHDFHCPVICLEHVHWACGQSFEYAREVSIISSLRGFLLHGSYSWRCMQTSGTVYVFAAGYQQLKMQSFIRGCYDKHFMKK